jgi:large subunit ribosomal protein L23
MKNNSPIIECMVTEKSSEAQSHGKYSFRVTRDATKIDIKNAVKKLYGMDVATVNIMISPKKTRLLKGKYEWAKRPCFKKAVVTLKGKKTMDPNKLKEPKEK